LESLGPPSLFYRARNWYICGKLAAHNAFCGLPSSRAFRLAIYVGQRCGARLTEKENSPTNVKQDNIKPQPTTLRLPANAQPAGNNSRHANVHRFNAFTLLTIAVLGSALLTSCTAVKPLKGGRAVTSHTPFGGIQQSIAQGDNPSQPTRQDQETVKVRTYTLPAGSRIEQPSPPASMSRQPAAESDPSLHYSNSPPLSLVLSSPMPVTEREETRAKTELGAAQRDNARELGAKLASLRGITWTGLALFVFGLASLVWPPLKAIIGSVTTSALITLGGLALIILPTLIVGNELLILGGVALAVTAWFLAHRHGQLRGQLAASEKSNLQEDPNPSPGSAVTPTNASLKINN
jgi:hypothetical protein